MEGEIILRLSTKHYTYVMLYTKPNAYGWDWAPSYIVGLLAGPSVTISNVIG